MVPLLDLDPDLARYVPADRQEQAARETLVHVTQLEQGQWDVERLLAADAGHVGLLIIDGLLGHELLAHDVASMELLGPGDLVRPWDESNEVHLLRAVVRWSAFAPTRLAVIDRRCGERLARHPAIYTALMERLSARAQRLAVMHAIAQMNRVDHRVMTLLWHLAERWGRVTPGGVLIPLALSHRTLAQLVGARRPTVSTAISQLARSGDLQRTEGGTWLLTGDPVGEPGADHRRFVAPRRTMLADATL
jgi:CRP/FNR family transcriptional regulator, cyclic AMP receptor protein